MIKNIKSQTDLSGLYVVYRGSVHNEYKGIYGITHLTEHLLCKSFDHMQDDFDRDGIGWNAYTSDSEVVFYMTGLDEFVNKHKYNFVESLSAFNISEEEFQNEKKIVIEEYKDSFNNQGQSHAMNLMRKLFDYYNPIGLLEDLENLTLQDVKDFMKMQYSKPHLLINVSKHNDFIGDIKFETTIPQKTLYYGDYDTTLELGNEYKGKSSIINISQMVRDDFSYVKFITSMLGSGLKSPLYQEIREKRGLVYFVRCSLSSETNDSGLIWIDSETSNENVAEFQDTIGMVLNNPKKYMTKERFDIIKQAFEIQLKKNEINRYNSIGKYITPIEWQVEPILKTITLDKVLEVYDKYFNFDTFYKSIDKDEFGV